MNWNPLADSWAADSPWMRSTSRDIIRVPLGDIVNLPLTSGTMVRLLLKKPSLDPVVLANNHPVSNLLFLGKIVERVVAEQLQVFLDGSSVLDPFQSGFCPGYGIEMALVTLMDVLQRHLD